MSKLESVFEVRSGMNNEPGEGVLERGMFATFDAAKKYADKIINDRASDYKWVSESRAQNRYYYIEISEHEVIY